MSSHILGSPVDAPPLLQQPHNLLRSSRTPQDPDGTRWEAGIQYRPVLNTTSTITGGYSQCGTSSTMPSGADPVPGLVLWQPVVQVVSKKCALFGWETSDWKQELADLAKAALPKFLEYELWTGSIAQKDGLDNLWLASTHSVDLTPAGGPTSVKRGYQILEEGLGDTGVGAAGMIHARRGNVPDYMGVHEDGNLLVTPNGTIVVGGAGYQRTDRSGAAATAGTAWLYATGNTDVRVGPLEFFPDDDGQPFDIDRSNNTGYLRAQRNVLVSWDGQVHLAVHVTLDT